MNSKQLPRCLCRTFPERATTPKILEVLFLGHISLQPHISPFCVVHCRPYSRYLFVIFVFASTHAKTRRMSARSLPSTQIFATGVVCEWVLCNSLLPILNFDNSNVDVRVHVTDGIKCCLYVGTLDPAPDAGPAPGLHSFRCWHTLNHSSLPFASDNPTIKI